MAGTFYKPFIQRAGLWASNSLGALIYALIFAAIFFVPCFLIVDRHRRRWIIRALQILGAVSFLLIPSLIVWVIQSGSWQREVVFGSMLAIFVLAGAGIGFLRSAEHGIEVATLQPQGEPVVHWSRVLRDHPRWWIRSRAARELGQETHKAQAAREALLASRPEEMNRHVRAAIADGLRRLGEPATPATS